MMMIMEYLLDYNIAIIIIFIIIYLRRNRNVFTNNQVVLI